MIKLFNNFITLNSDTAYSKIHDNKTVLPKKKGISLLPELQHQQNDNVQHQEPSLANNNAQQ